LRKGCTFDGWFEGVISFAPTYKYEFDSENYVSDESESGRRTPAWYVVLLEISTEHARKQR
jgi:type I inositol polyphosphate 5-phosphatase IP5P1/2